MSTASWLHAADQRLSSSRDTRDASGGDISGDIEVATRNAQRLAEAHRELRADATVQFDLLPPPPPPQPPAWLRAFFDWLGDALKPLGDFLRWIGSQMPDVPYARIILWALLIAVLLWLSWLLYLHFFPLHAHRRTRSAAGEAVEDIAPEAAAARGWLQEADALAAQGHYAEAVHHLLIRSIEDIGRRRPQLLKPALTSRDIAAAKDIPVVPRHFFANIAAVVERSLFGGGAVDAGDWSTCRAAYSDFAEKRGWTR